MIRGTCLKEHDSLYAQFIKYLFKISNVYKEYTGNRNLKSIMIEAYYLTKYKIKCLFIRNPHSFINLFVR